MLIDLSRVGVSGQLSAFASSVWRSQWMNPKTPKQLFIQGPSSVETNGGLFTAPRRLDPSGE